MTNAPMGITSPRGELLEPVGCPSSFLIVQLEEGRGTPDNERRNGERGVGARNRVGVSSAAGNSMCKGPE